MLRAYRENGMPVDHNDVVTDFRGRNWLYVAPVRPSREGYAGKIRVKDENGNIRDFYDTVFKLTVEELDIGTSQ